MITNIEKFDRIYIINLKRRADRLNNFFHNNHFIIGSLSNIEVFEAIDGNKTKNELWEFEKGALGCLESHLAILKHAKMNNYAHILILEDDFIFDKEFESEFAIGMQELDINWDMLYLYSNHIVNPKPYSHHLNKISSSLGTVAYAVQMKAFDLLIKLLELRSREVDVIYAHMHFLLQAYSFKKNICHHVEGFSDIQNKLVQYNHTTNESLPARILASLKFRLKKIIKSKP